jgi:hypothetical protein
MEKREHHGAGGAGLIATAKHRDYSCAAMNSGGAPRGQEEAMKKEWVRWAGRGIAWLGMLALLGVLASCDENQDVETLPPPAPRSPQSGPGVPAPQPALPPGQGTIDSPYLLQWGKSFASIPIPRRGAAFFVVESVPAGWSTVKTTSQADVDLLVFGFRSILASESEFGSRIVGSGNEQVTALGDGINSSLYFVVDGARVNNDGARFDVSVSSAPAPVAVSFTMGPCTLTIPSPPPTSSCGDKSNLGSSVFEAQLPFPIAGSAPLSISITNATGAWVFYRAKEFRDSSSFLPFTSNTPVYDGPGNTGWCHANNSSGAPLVGSTGTCKVNPVSGWDPPQVVQVVNNSPASGFPVTIAFSSP